MRNSPAGMRARFGAAVAVIVRAGPGGLRDQFLSSPVTKGQYSPGRRAALRAGNRSKVSAMRLEPFAMERMQSTYENEVEYNLSESGVHPLRLGDLVDDEPSRQQLLSEALRYTQSNGTIPLRAAIAAIYPGATADHIQVTNGGSEANYITTWNLVEPGDEVVLMVPNYMQTWGLARAFGGVVKEWPLKLGGP